MRINASYQEAKQSEVGTVFVDEMIEDVRFIILRGPASLCAYVGVPSYSLVHGVDYNNVDVDAHGGLTYSDTKLLTLKRNKVVDNEGRWWLGWDYAHLGDCNFYDETAPKPSKKWNVNDVYKDSEQTLYDFIDLQGEA